MREKDFVPATNLWIGAELIDKNGNMLHVEQMYHEYLEDERCTVYNFQVEDFHTYFVGEQCIWVHNATYPRQTLNNLENTENFTDKSIDHIFEGDVNGKGNGTGYHYEGIEGSPGSVIEGTRGKPNEFGVYKGEVEINGVSKTGNGGVSTFSQRI